MEREKTPLKGFFFMGTVSMVTLIMIAFKSTTQWKTFQLFPMGNTVIFCRITV